MSVTQMSRSDDALDTLADHCMAARAVIEEAGTSAMRHLIDLLLFEVGVAMAKRAPGETAVEARD